MIRNRYSLVFVIFIMVDVMFFPYHLGARELNNTDIPVIDKTQALIQSPAREFSPCQTGASDKTGNQFPINRIFQTEFTIQNTGHSYKNQTTLWCYIPYSNGYNQVVPKVSTTEDACLLADSHGNSFLRFDIKDIPPYATRIIRVDCEVMKSREPHNSIKNNKDQDRLNGYLLPEPLLEADHQKIKDLSKRLKKREPYQTARSIFSWVSANITYSGFDKQDKGALHGLTYKEGDCTEQASLFTALCRAGGIPAKLIWGYRCPGNCHGTERIHTWSEFYADDTWHLVDITNHIFDKDTENYIGLRDYRHKDPNPLGNRHRYRMEFSFEDVKTRMDIKSVVRLH